MEVALGLWPGIVQGCCSGWISWGLSPCFVLVGFFLNLDCGSWRLGGGLALLGVLFGCFFLIFVFNFLLWGFYLFKALGLPGWMGSGLTSLCASPRVYLIIKTNQKKKKAAVLCPGQ